MTILHTIHISCQTIFELLNYNISSRHFCSKYINMAMSDKIGLDETNNESYRYLKSVGNTWQFDLEDLHPKVNIYRPRWTLRKSVFKKTYVLTYW